MAVIAVEVQFQSLRKSRLCSYMAADLLRSGQMLSTLFLGVHRMDVKHAS
jgi:hypothetical protein